MSSRMAIDDGSTCSHDVGKARTFTGYLRLSLILTAIFAAGCGLFKDPIGDHKKICMSNGRIVVHDRQLWAEYLIQAEKGLAARALGAQVDISSVKISPYETPPGFDRRFGQDLKRLPKMEFDKIVQEDMFLLKDRKIVARYINYYFSEQGFDAAFIIDCVSQYPELYKSEL